MSRLPVFKPQNRIRPSRSIRWRAAVLILVHLAIAAHFTHWLVNGRTVTPVEPSEAAALAVSGVVNAGAFLVLLSFQLATRRPDRRMSWGCLRPPS